MAEAHRTYFRPTVVICVGEVGREIRDQLTPDGGRLRRTSSGSSARPGSRLLTSLDHPLRQGVSFIQFPSEQYDDTAQSPDNVPAQCWYVDDMFEQIERLAHHGLPTHALWDEGVPDDFQLQPVEEGVPLQRIFQDALVHVQAQENLLNVGNAGFMIVNPNTQIFIVGDVKSEWIGYALQVVHRQLERFHLQTEVSFILSRYEPDSSGRVEWTERIDWGQRSLANFNFLYENAMRESNRKQATFLTKEQSYYTAAEALFSLIATGMTTMDQYQQPMKMIPNQKVYEKVGNLSTSLVVFPYRAVRRFCSGQLGAELMDDWLDDINKSSVLEGERTRLQERARVNVNEIEDWIKDNEIRPGTEYLSEQKSSRRAHNDPARTKSRTLRWPSLAILRNPAQRQKADRLSLEHERMEERDRREQREREEEANRQEHLRRYGRLRDQTRALFEFFSYKEVKKESREHPDGPEAWAEIALGRSSRASDMIVNWSSEANQTWAAVSQRASNNVQRTVDRIWPATNNGLDLARIYIDEYDERLTELANLLNVWRRTHRADYLSTLSEFERLADGPWVRNEDDPTITNSMNAANAGQARPMGANAGASGTIVTPMPGGFLKTATLPHAVVSAPPGGSGGGPPPQRQQTVGLHQHLPERERGIARRLGQRLTWEYSRVPRWPNLAAAGILAAPVIILTLLALVPALAATPLNILAVVAGTIALIGLGSWLFRRFQERNLIKIQKELLKFYSYYYANRCETREDFLRVNVLAPLRMRVSRMRERLDDMRGFILLVSNRMEEAAREAHDGLFEPRLNPAAVRDVYVGNGALLQRSDWGRNVPNITPQMIRQQRLDRRSRQRNRSTTNERERQRRFEQRAINTLEDCAERVHAKRLSERRREPWHHPAELRPALLMSFQNNPHSILEMSVEEAVRYIDGFTGPVIGAYLTDNDPDLVSIGLALDWKETWDAVFDRMERPVYLLLGGNTSTELVFICGRQQDIDSGQRYIEKRQRDYIRVDTNNPDWLLIAGFFRDNAPAALNVDRLFPLNSSFVP